MLELFNLGVSEEEYKNMLNICSYIRDLSELEIKQKLMFLESIGCTNNQVKNIVITNPYYLDKDINNIKELIDYLNNKGFSCLNILFDSNPFIFNINVDKIEGYINSRINKDNLNDIIDELENNTYLFDEM